MCGNFKKVMEKAKVSGKAKISNQKTSMVKDNIEFALMALPGFILFILFNYLPMYGVIIAFKDFKPLKGIMGSEWVGLENFRFFFTSQDAFRVTRNTLLYNGTFIILGMILPVIFALMLYFLRSNIGRKVYNTVAILPNFLSAVIVAFIVYALFNSQYGVVNAMMEKLGMQPIEWYTELRAWPFILVIVKQWMTIGMSSVLYYASLVSIDDSLFEAAKIDGANTFTISRKICVPHLKQIIIIQAILAVGGIFGGDFGLFYQVPRDQGVLYPVTDIIPTYIFRGLQSGSSRDMSISAAVGLFQAVVGMLLVIITNAIVSKVSPEDSLF